MQPLEKRDDIREGKDDADGGESELRRGPSSSALS